MTWDIFIILICFTVVCTIVFVGIGYCNDSLTMVFIGFIFMVIAFCLILVDKKLTADNDVKVTYTASQYDIESMVTDFELDPVEDSEIIEPTVIHNINKYMKRDKWEYHIPKRDLTVEQYRKDRNS